jgi:hypothetical protein
MQAAEIKRSEAEQKFYEDSVAYLKKLQQQKENVKTT